MKLFKGYQQDVDQDPSIAAKVEPAPSSATGQRSARFADDDMDGDNIPEEQPAGSNDINNYALFNKPIGKFYKDFQKKNDWQSSTKGSANADSNGNASDTRAEPAKNFETNMHYMTKEAKANEKLGSQKQAGDGERTKFLIQQKWLELKQNQQVNQASPNQDLHDHTGHHLGHHHDI